MKVHDSLEMIMDQDDNTFEFYRKAVNLREEGIHAQVRCCMPSTACFHTGTIAYTRSLYLLQLVIGYDHFFLLLVGVYE